MAIFFAQKAICLLLIFGLAATSLGAIYPVTWEPGVDPSTSLQGVTLHPGDSLDFLNPGELLIFLVDQTVYEECIASPDNVLIGQNAVTVYSITADGSFYFVSDIVDCQRGLKLAIQVS